MIHSTIATKQLIPYMSKHGLPPEMFHKVCWTLLGETLSLFPEIFQVWYSKHICNFCGIGSQMVYMRKWPSDTCRCCGVVSERDSFHMMLCRNKELLLTRRILLSNLLQRMKNMKSHPFIIRMYENVLLGKRISIPGNNTILFSALHDLKLLGPKNILNGYLPQSILHLQKTYLFSSITSYKKWARDFISMFLIFSHRV